jgi:hypothetical protein
MPETPNRPPAIQIRDKGRLEEERLRVLRLVSEAESALRDVRAGVEDGRKLFLPTQGYTLPQKAPYPGATEAFVALVATNVEQLAARITQTLCGADVYVLVQPESAEDRDDAAMAQMFLQTQAEQQLQLRDKVIRPLVYATLTSKVGIAYVGWEERRRTRIPAGRRSRRGRRRACPSSPWTAYRVGFSTRRRGSGSTRPSRGRSPTARGARATAGTRRPRASWSTTGRTSG